MEDLSNKPLSYTGNHPLERLYRAALARAEAAEVEAADDRLELGHEIDQRNRLLATIAAAAGIAVDDDVTPDEWTESIVGAIDALATRVAELEAAVDWRPPDTAPRQTDIILLSRGQVWGPPGHEWVLATDEQFFGWQPLPPDLQEPTP